MTRMMIENEPIKIETEFDRVYSLPQDLSNSISIDIVPMFDEFKRVDKLLFTKIEYYRSEFNKYMKLFDECKNKSSKSAIEYKSKANQNFAKFGGDGKGGEFKGYYAMLHQFRKNVFEIKDSDLTQDEKALAYCVLYFTCQELEKTINILEWKTDLTNNRSDYLLGLEQNSIGMVPTIKKNLESALEMTQLHISNIEQNFENIENYENVFKNYKHLKEAIKNELENCRKGKDINIANILKLEEKATESFQKYVTAITTKKEHKKYYAENNFFKSTIYFLNEDKPWVLDAIVVAGSLGVTLATKGAASPTLKISLGLFKTATTGYFIGTGLTNLVYDDYAGTATPLSVIKNTSRVLIGVNSLLNAPSLIGSSSLGNPNSIWFRPVNISNSSHISKVITSGAKIGSAIMQAGIFIDTGDIIINASKLGWTTDDINKLISNGILIGMGLIPYIEEYIRDKTSKSLYEELMSRNLDNIRINPYDVNGANIEFLNEQGLSPFDLKIREISENKILVTQSTKDLGEFSIILDKNDFFNSLTNLSEYNISQKGEMGDLLINYSRISNKYSFSDFISELYEYNVPVNVGGLLLNENFRNSFYELSGTKEFQRLYGKVDISKLWEANFIRYEGTNPIYRVITSEGAEFFLKFDDCSPDLFSTKLAKSMGMPFYSVIPSNNGEFAVIEGVYGYTTEMVMKEKKIPISFKNNKKSFISLENSDDYLKDYLKQKYNHSQGRAFAFEFLIKLADSHAKNYILQVNVKENNIDYNVTRIDYEGIFKNSPRFNQLRFLYSKNWFMESELEQGFIDTWIEFQNNKANIIKFITYEIDQNPNMVQYLKNNELDPVEVIKGIENLLEEPPLKAWDMFLKGE